MFFRAEKKVSNGKILITVSIISELFQKKYMFLKIATILLLRNVLKLAASLLPNMAGWLLQCVEMLSHKCESILIFDISIELSFLCVCFSGCSTEETLCGPKCNSSTLLLRTDTELHHSTGNNQIFFDQIMFLIVTIWVCLCVSVSPV